jgi:transcriptional regulator
MYVPKHFAEDDPAALRACIEASPFATVVSMLEGQLIATHVPVLLDGDAAPGGTLTGHVARANPHWRAFDGVAESLVIFTGPHAYVSPAWYSEMPAVPTWNYTAVHVYGVARAIQDPPAILPKLDRLIATFDRHGYGPSSVPDDYRTNLARGIVGFEVTISRVEGKTKLSQNRPVEDQHSVVHHLSQSADATEHSLAELMQARLEGHTAYGQNIYRPDSICFMPYAHMPLLGQPEAR